MTDYDQFDMTGLAQLVRKGDVTPTELLDAALRRMEDVNGALTAVVVSAEDEARRRIAKGLPDGAFQGVPFLLKDMGCEAVGYPAHEGSRLMAGSTYPVDSHLFARLAATGLVPFGRTAAPENGIGVATEAAAYGSPTRNPWDLDRTPGGSSGGSGAAVAAGIVPGAHGSDGGGSIRIPASNCHLFGFKATRGRLPDGPYSGEGWGGLAIEGFLTRSVRDTAALLDASMGPDVGAPYHAPPLKRSLTEVLLSPPKTLRIAVCDTRLDGTPISRGPRDAVAGAAVLLDDMGHDVSDARPKADHHGMMRAWCDIVASGVLASTEAELTRLGRPLHEDDLEPLGRAAMAHARTLSGADYLNALSTIHRYGREMAAFFEDWDVLLTPTLAEPPAQIGRFAHDHDDFLAYRLGPGMCFDYSPYTAAFNATGQPAMSVPFAIEDGLPIGVHLAGRFGEDDTLISLAADIERARPWDHLRAPLAPPQK